jgi:photosystem II stability/assembly factor-like uncharacterized protein
MNSPRTLSLLFSAILAAAGLAQWNMLTLPTWQGRYDDIFFLNAGEGWACNGGGYIHHTTDGGDTWDLQYASSEGEYLRCIEFTGPDTGFCGTLDGRFLKTVDGGESWANIMGSITPWVPGICGLSAPTEDVICGVGIWHTPAYFIRSTDGGTTWTYTNMAAHARALVDVHFASPLEGWASGMAPDATDGGVLLHTTDGGETWTEQYRTNVSGEYVWKIQTPDGLHFFASVDGNPAAGNTRFVRSADGGQNWTGEVASTAYHYVQAIGFITPHHGWIGGDDSLLETLDGGETWNPMALGSGYNRFFRLNDSLAFLSAFQVFRWDGPFTTGVEEVALSHEVDEMRISPNPTEGRFTVDARLVRPSRAKLHVYDAQARLVTTAVDAPLPAGPARWTIDLSAQPPGTFFVVLHTNDGQVQQRVAIVR